MSTADRVRELLEEGKTVLEIARLLEISPQAVYKHIDRNGWAVPTERTAS